MFMVQYYDQLVHFDKEINANVYRHSLWEYCKRFHCSFEWHLTPLLGGHPVISGHYSIPRGCPPNTTFTVFAYLNVINSVRVRACFSFEELRVIT